MSTKPPATDIRLLLEIIRTPYAALGWLAVQCEQTIEALDADIKTLLDQQWIEALPQAFSRYPQWRYAPTVIGISEAANAVGLTPEVLAQRLRYVGHCAHTLRVALEIAHDAGTILSATQRHCREHTPAMQCEAELFAPRRYKNADLFLHGQFVRGNSRGKARPCHPYVLHIDRGDSSVWQWWGHLRYLATWAGRLAPNVRPTLLIVSPRPFRATAMLMLARMAGTTQAMPVAATALRELAVTQGLIAVAQQPNGWRMLLPNQTLVSADPFQHEGVDAEAYERSAFAVMTVARALVKRDSDRRTRVFNRSSPIPTPPAGIERLESLEDAAQRMLMGLCRYPVATPSILAGMLDLPQATVVSCLDQLARVGLAETVASKIDEAVWVATDMGAQLQLAREMQPASALKRYGFFRADHTRRVIHTLTGYRFFTALREHCQRRSRAMRKLDTRPSTVNDGRIPYYELAVIESELMAADWFVRDGVRHYWRPDGYGALRAGTRWTRFWLEIDGTTGAPSRKDPQVWAGKMARLCDYAQTGRWALRYPELPRLLIVSTDLRNGPLIFDTLSEAARAHAMPPPRVFIASHEAIRQRGALAKIWHEVTHGDEALGYAFDGVAPIAIKPEADTPRRDLLADLQRADQMGLLDFQQVLRPRTSEAKS